MARDIKRKAGQYCANCRKSVMAVNDTSFMSGGGWNCPDCGHTTFGMIGRSMIQAKQRKAESVPKYNVTCPGCSRALSAPAGPSIKCPFCGYRLSVAPLPQPSQPSVRTGASAATDPVAQLMNLKELRDSGDLTPDEFATLKARIVSGEEEPAGPPAIAEASPQQQPNSMGQDEQNMRCEACNAENMVRSPKDTCYSCGKPVGG